MRRRSRAVIALLGLLVALPTWWEPRATALGPSPSRAGASAERLTDREFWAISTGFSEPDGFFQSDNLVSNETTFQWVIPPLQQAWVPGHVYLGVGPDQNFTYIANLKPAMAFIVDIRRGNLLLHLMYKALFELSPDRAAFLSRLFARPRPPRLPATAPPEDLFRAYVAVPSSREWHDKSFKAMVDLLVKEHGFVLTAQDIEGIEYVYAQFHASGPYLTYSNSGRGARYPTYQELMIAGDAAGRQRGYLASEELYRVVRDLHRNNLIVPVVGNFAGDKAIRTVGRYLRERKATVGAIYTSNVEQYLFQYGTWAAYYDNVATLPTDESSRFIRSCFNSLCSTPAWSRSASLIDPVAPFLKDVADGKIRSYFDVLARSR